MIHITGTCYGCSVCAAACPKGCISMALSREGFWVPSVDGGECIECGICERCCSWVSEGTTTPRKILGSYSAVHRNEEIRKRATSGGAAYGIAQTLLGKGYSVLGVEYDNASATARHFVSYDEGELQKTLNSKYLQSYTVEAFKKLPGLKKAVVFGSPCQISSLRRWERLEGSDHIFVDFFCHGVPSYLLWKSYLAMRLKPGEKLTAPLFRDKCNGWHNYTMTLKTTERMVSSALSSGDPFHVSFLGNYVQNLPCYSCKYRLSSSDADLRVGDLWGRRYEDDEKGVSGVLCLTEKGAGIMSELRALCSISEEGYGTVIEGQMKRDLKVPAVRARILKKLEGGTSLFAIMVKYEKATWAKSVAPKKLKRIVKKAVCPRANKV